MNIQPKRFLRREQVVAKVGISKTAIYLLERAGKFPAHINITPRCAVYDEAAIEAWMAKRISAPGPAAPAPDVRQRRHAPGRGKRQQAVA